MSENHLTWLTESGQPGGFKTDKFMKTKINNTRHWIAFASFFCLFLSMQAQVQVDVKILSPNSFSFHLSGKIVGPAPNNSNNILFVDVPVDPNIFCSDFSFSGTSMIGAQSVFEIHSGYNNAPYAGSIQFRVPSVIGIGDTVHGCDTVTFGVAHGLTQGMFDGLAPLYWGRGAGQTAGTLQGYADSLQSPVTIVLGNNQSFCNDGPHTLQEIIVQGDTGATFTWYDALTGGNSLVPGHVMQDGQTYYVSQDGTNCLAGRAAVTISLNTVTTPTIVQGDTLNYCNGDIYTLQDIMVLGDSGASFTWYDSLNGGNALPLGDTLQGGQLYFVSQSIAGCEGVRAQLSVFITILDTSITQLGDTLTANMGGLQYQWINCDSNTAIIGATGQSFVPTINGFYAVILSDGACTDTSACREVSGIIIIGLDENKPGSMVSVFPNPNHGLFKVDAGEKDIQLLEIFDVQGRKLLTIQPHPGPMDIDLSAFGKGHYVLRIRTEVETVSTRIVILGE